MEGACGVTVVGSEFIQDLVGFAGALPLELAATSRKAASRLFVLVRYCWSI